MPILEKYIGRVRDWLKIYKQPEPDESSELLMQIRRETYFNTTYPSFLAEKKMTKAK